jgi:hypothetical protein
VVQNTKSAVVVENDRNTPVVHMGVLVRVWNVLNRGRHKNTRVILVV